MAFSPRNRPHLAVSFTAHFLALFTISAAGLASPVFSQPTGGRFINNILSGKCIDVSGAPGRENGTPLILWDCELTSVNPDNNSITDQRWILTSQGFIRNALSGKCIDVAGAPGRANGDKLQLWDCELSGRNSDNGTITDQRWFFTSGGFIRNRLSGKCIDVAGAPGRSNGSTLQLWDCELSGRNADNNSATDQRWQFQD